MASYLNEYNYNHNSVMEEKNPYSVIQDIFIVV